jgi:hypothetical protein
VPGAFRLALIVIAEKTRMQPATHGESDLEHRQAAVRQQAAAGQRGGNRRSKMIKGDGFAMSA